MRAIASNFKEHLEELEEVSLYCCIQDKLGMGNGDQHRTVVGFTSQTQGWGWLHRAAHSGDPSDCDSTGAQSSIIFSPLHSLQLTTQVFLPRRPRCSARWQQRCMAAKQLCLAAGPAARPARPPVLSPEAATTTTAERRGRRCIHCF